MIMIRRGATESLIRHLTRLSWRYALLRSNTDIIKQEGYQRKRPYEGCSEIHMSCYNDISTCPHTGCQLSGTTNQFICILLHIISWRMKTDSLMDVESLQSSCSAPIHRGRNGNGFISNFCIQLQCSLSIIAISQGHLCHFILFTSSFPQGIISVIANYSKR